MQDSQQSIVEYNDWKNMTEYQKSVHTNKFSTKGQMRHRLLALGMLSQVGTCNEKIIHGCDSKYLKSEPPS
jgi:hypothetical protein